MLPGAGSVNPPLNVLAVPSSNLPVQAQTRDFDPGAEEFVYFWVAMPKSWNLGTISFRYVWSHAATATNFGVVFDLYANAFSNDDTLAGNAGPPGEVADVGGTTNDLYLSDESSAITVTGGPAANDLVHFRLNRVVANANDTLAVDARLHGVIIYYTTNAETDV
jgi:hypothetical protein